MTYQYSIQDFSDVKTESKAVDSTLQIACACSCILENKKLFVFTSIQNILLYQLQDVLQLPVEYV